MMARTMLASVLGRSRKMIQPTSVATGISRYCIGASVAEGANRSRADLRIAVVHPAPERLPILRLVAMPQLVFVTPRLDPVVALRHE